MLRYGGEGEASGVRAEVTGLEGAAVLLSPTLGTGWSLT